MRKNIILPTVIGAAAITALLASADGDAPHRFISFDGENWTDLSKISEITFKKEHQQFTFPDGEENYEVNWHLSKISIKTEDGNVRETTVDSYLAQKEFENTFEMPAGKQHPLFNPHDESLRVFVPGAEAPDSAYLKSYPEGLIARYQYDDYIGLMREGERFKAEARCEYCTPKTFISSENGSSGTDGEYLIMGYEPSRIIAQHEPGCLHTYLNVLNNFNNKLYGPYFDYSPLCNGVYFGGGEAGVMKLFGDYFSQDCFSEFRANMTGGNPEWFAAQFNRNNTIIPDTGWRRYYTLLGENPAVSRLDLNGDGIFGDDEIVTLYGSYSDVSINTLLYLNARMIENYPLKADELNEIKAELLTARANIYSRLLQIFAPRWEDSAEGNTPCIPIMELPEDLKVYEASLILYKEGQHDYNSPLRSMNEVRDRIYQDIDAAVALFSKIKSSARSQKWLPDANVALGIKARTALFTHDWETAARAALMASESYEIMKADDYLQGFFLPTSETMWAEMNEDSGAPSGMGFWCFGASNAINGPYPETWGINPGVIDIELFNRMDSTDIRRKCFIMPEIITDSVDNVGNNRNILIKRFWDSADPDNGLIKNNLTRQYIKAHILKYQDKFYFKYIPYVSDNTPMLIGTQIKFWGKNAYGEAAFPLMRVSEMVLTRAEALLELGNRDEAIAALNQIRINRGLEALTAAAGNDELREEIRLQRRLELWGEGHNWFDFKRWNLPIKQKPLNKTLRNGNIPARHALDIPVDSLNGWKYPIPEWELRRNAALSNPAE